MHPSCPDYDLCQDCEALPIAVHPRNHPMLKIKTPYTAIPIVHRHDQGSHASGSITPTRSFIGSRTNENIHGTSSPGTPVGVIRTATPTPASAGLETSVPMKGVHDWLSSSNNQSNSSFISASPRKASSDPFADIFSVEPRPVHLPPTQGDAIEMVNPWPTTDDSKRGEFLRLIAELSGNTSPQCPAKSEDDDPKEDVFNSEVSLHLFPGALPGVVYDEPPAIQTAPLPASVVPVTDSDPQFLETVSPERKPTADVSAVLARIVSELPSLVPPPLPPSAETRFTAPSAAFVEDVSVPDGQVFPPGAEFIKSWRMINDSGCEWPESTELVFLAGDSLSASASEKMIAVPVGKIGPGETTDVSTGELKAPEVAGRYVGYWRLRADGKLFGNSVWIE